MSFSESSTAVGSLIDSLEAEAGTGTSDTPPAPVEATKEGQQAPPQPQTPEAKGITEPKPKEGAATPPVVPTQSPFPKELETYKPLFEAKKWDPSKPDWQGEALKTLQEQEQFQGRLTTDLGLTRTQAHDLSQALLGTPESINEYRQRMGAQPLSFDATSLEDKIKAVGDEWALWEKALSQDEKASAEAIRAISQKLQDRRDELRLEKLAASKAGPRAAPDDSQKIVNWASILEKDPQANKAMTALVPFLKSKLGVGILGSFGMDVHNIMSTPERAKQAYDLAQRVYRGSPEVFEAEVTKRVQAEMESQRKLQVQGAIPGGVPAAVINNNQADAVSNHLEGMFTRR